MIAAIRSWLNRHIPLMPPDVSNLDRADGIQDPDADFEFYQGMVAGQMRISGRFDGWNKLHFISEVQS